MNNSTVFESGRVKDFEYKVIGATLAGISHAKKNIKNQDCLGFQKNHKGVLIAVADGVGSCLEAQKGSKYAIETIKKLHDKIESGQIRANARKKIKEFIIEDWKNKVSVSPSDYSTTLRFAIVFSNSLLLGGIGDSAIFVSINGEEQLLNRESSPFSNITFSLTQDMDESKFEIVKIDIPFNTKNVSIFIATDGITSELQEGKQIEFLNYLARKVREKGDNYQVEMMEWVNSLQEKNGDDKTMLLFTAERISS